MTSIRDRLTRSHAEFVSTGYLKLMEPIASVLIRLRITANQLTTFGTLATVMGGVAFAFGQVRLAGVIIGVMAISDALDGIVARRTGKVTLFGAFYDSTLDRVADGALLAGLAFFFATDPVHGSPGMLAVSLAAIIGTYLVSYARARAEALGINAKVGFMQRAERVALLSAPQAIFGLALGGWVLRAVVVILAVSAWSTAIRRINYVRRKTLGDVPLLQLFRDKPVVPAARASRRANQ